MEKSKQINCLPSKLSFLKRATLCKNLAAQRLCAYIARKQTNLVLAADVTDSKTLLRLAEQFGPLICLLKTHVDILVDFTADLTEQLRAVANKHGFLICEDRKFADIGSTTQHQLYGGLYQIAKWADFITAHTIAGASMLESLYHNPYQNNASSFSSPGIFLIVEMSTIGQLADSEYARKSLIIANQYPDLIAGFIGQSTFNQNPQYLQLTPGIQLTASKNQDGFGQCYRTPKQAIQSNGTDLIIVGRGILEAEAPYQQAEIYRQLAWAAYKDNVS
jgi:uridine monophosphate synthetase